MVEITYHQEGDYLIPDLYLEENYKIDFLRVCLTFCLTFAIFEKQQIFQTHYMSSLASLE